MGPTRIRAHSRHVLGYVPHYYVGWLVKQNKYIDATDNDIPMHIKLAKLQFEALNINLKLIGVS